MPDTIPNDDDIPRHVYDQRVADVFEGYQNPLGMTQIVCVSRGGWAGRVGPFLSWPLAMSIVETNKPLMAGVTVIAPPGSEVADIRTQVCRSMAAHHHRQGGRPPEDGPIEWLERTVTVVRAEHADLDEIVRIVEQARPRTAIAILELARYTLAAGSAHSAADTAPSGLAVGQWAMAVHDLTNKLATVVVEHELYVVIDTGQPQPPKRVAEMLVSGTNCALFSAPAIRPEAKLDAALQNWRAILKQGSVGSVLNAVEAIDGLSDLERAVLRIQVMAAADLRDLALTDIRALDPDAALFPDHAAKLSLIAAEAGGTDTAIALLRRHRDEFLTLVDLETALRAAQRVADDELIAAFGDTLEQKYPESELVTHVRYTAALKRHDHRAAHDVLVGRSDMQAKARMHLYLAKAFENSGVPDYLTIVANSEDETREFVRTQCARHAMSLGLASHALDLLLTPEAISAATGTFTLCETLEMVLLRHGPGGALAVDQDRLVAGVETLIARLAVDTRNTPLRVRLLDMLEPHVAGALGTPILIKVLRRAAARVVEVIERPRIVGSVTLRELMENDEFKNTFTAWMKSETLLRVGHMTFPAADLPASADQICEGVLDEINLEARRITSESADGLLMVLAFGAAVSKHATLPDLDLPMIRTAAIGLKLGGSDQRARDTIETILEISATPRRRRLAWLGIADVYARCNQNLEAALYAAAGLHGGGDVDEHQLWHETLVVHRLQRDLGAFDDARETLKRAKRLLVQMGRHKDYDHRIETMAIATLLSEARINSMGLAEFAGLLARTAANAQSVLDAGDEAEPVTVLLVQLIRYAKQRNVPVPVGAEALVAQLKERLGSSVAQQAEIFSHATPTVDDLMTLLGLSSGQRYSSEVGTDAKAAVLTARRALDSDDTLLDVDATCLALEIAADRALAMPGWTDAKLPPPPPENAQAPSEAMRRVSADGTTVILAGLASDGSLVRVTAANGKLETPVREDRSLFSRDLLDEWRKDYPYLYGLPEMPANGFLTTTERLRFSALPKGPVLLIGDTQMASFPPNLLRAAPTGSRVPAQHAGALFPTSAAPSLSWLNAARDRITLGDGRRLAWMPGGGTMKAIADLCSDPLKRYGFELDAKERLPDQFSGASMAIVAAHGRLNPNGGAFQVVSDEGRLAVSASDLARSLHNVGVAILFVCSGGRSDKHPASDATMGLARQILDQGAQAVVATPWPLESLVPPRWLPTFFDRWDAGDTIAKAVHLANLYVYSRTDNDPAQGLAMTVFGNPDVRNR